MTEIAAEQYIGSLYGTGQDASDALNAMTAAVPDFSTIRFNQVGGTLTLTKPWIIHGKTGVSILGPVLIEELPQATLMDGGVADGAPIIRLDSCGHCTFSGFALNSAGPGGIEICGDGPPRISTNNTIAFNRCINAGGKADWIGISIAHGAEQNNEAMQIRNNFLISNGTGIGIYLGANSNNHMHFLFRNSTYGCKAGVTGLWGGFHALHCVSEGDQCAYALGHLCYPCVIDFQDLESSGTFLQTTGGSESSIIIRAARVAGCGLDGGAIFDLIPGSGPVTIEGCDYQNYTGSLHDVYRNGSRRLTLIGNNYSNYAGQGFHGNWISGNSPAVSDLPSVIVTQPASKSWFGNLLGRLGL